MPRVCRIITFALASAVSIGVLAPVASRAVAAENGWKLPPLSGEIQGEFRPLTVADAPSLHWKITLRTAHDDSRAADLVVDGPGTELRAELRLDASGVVTWRIASARVDVTTWSAAIVPLLGSEFADVEVRGFVTLEGEGALSDGEPTGTVRLVLRDGRIDDPAHKILIEGISLDLAVMDLAARRFAPAQELTWTGGKYDVISFGAGRVVFTRVGDEVQVSEALVEILGGELVVAAFNFSVKRREASLIARVSGIELGELMPLLPPVLRSARGMVDGSVTLHRTPNGIQIGSGRLALRSGETAVVRLAPTSGLLSQSLPKAVLEHYPGLGLIEAGEVPIHAQHLELTITPGGDAKGRSATIRIAGGPVDPSLRAPIDLNVNVRGPLHHFVKFGTHSRLSFGGIR